MPNERFTIKDWSMSDRPREKLMQLGAGALSNAELLAIVIGSGYRTCSAVEVARQLLHHYHDDLQLLGRCPVEELSRHKGLGPAKATAIAAVMELGRRRDGTGAAQGGLVTSSADIYRLLKPMLGDLVWEEFWIVLLNRAHRIITWHKISQGGISSTTADVRMIIKKAVDCLASGLVLCHNHPSGNLQPSREDIGLTSQVKQAVAMVDIVLLDHIIIGGTGYYSFADHGAV